MRILFTTQYGGVAGSTYSVLYLAKGLAEKGHEVHLACERGTELARMVSSEANLHYHEIPFKGYLDLKSIRSLVKVVKTKHIQVLNAQLGHDRTIAIWAKWFYRLSVKIIFTRRQRPRDEPWLKRWLHLATAEKIVLVSEGLREMFLQKGYPEQRLEVINNGIPEDFTAMVDEAKVDNARKELKLTGQVVGCVSRLKKQEQLIAALRHLPGDITVLFLGIDQDQVQPALDKYQPPQRIICLGTLSRGEAINYFKLMHINVLPSVMDGFGLVLVEAMQLGIPVVGTNRGGIKSVIEHEKSGLLFEDGDIAGLAACISRLLQDRPLRDRLIKNGHERAQYFSLAKTIDRYETLYQSVL